MNQFELHVKGKLADLVSLPHVPRKGEYVRVGYDHEYTVLAVVHKAETSTVILYCKKVK